MRIAIMTWFRYYNYGTALQVSALYWYLTKQGHKVDVIDYEPQIKGDSYIHSYKLHDYVQLKLKRERELPQPYYPPFESEERNALFEQFLGKHISLSKQVKLKSELEDLNAQYQAFICGSDQIWSPILFDPHFFFDFVKDTEKMIAYAPSMGLSKVNDRYVAQAMADLVGRFKHLSIREANGAAIIHELTGQSAEVVVDPTMLLSKKEWVSLSLDSRVSFTQPYMLVYMLGNEREHWEQIYRIAEHKQLMVRIIPTYKDSPDKEGCIEEAVGPEEFLHLIECASYVCTDSFHGIIFSMIFHRDFSVFERFSVENVGNQNSRISNLLRITRLQNRLIPFHGVYQECPSIDYSVVQDILQNEISRSKGFLKSALSAVSEHKSKRICHVMQDHSLCCGCGACAAICPVNAISIRMNEKGFWSAFVDEKKCVGCGKCKDSCVFEGENEAVNIRLASYYSYKDSRAEVLKASSSGGFSYAVSEMMIKKGYSVIGCKFDTNDKRARHCIITDVEGLPSLQGSKYIQSYFAKTFGMIDKRTPIVVTGTPCQIASARKRFGEQKDILYIDFICHGVPTYHLLDRYIEYHSKHVRMQKENMNIQFRFKENGWREKSIRLSWPGKSIVISQDEDYFYRVFEARNCYMSACYDCRWRDSSAADLRMGDYWGPRFANDKTGVSMVACFTGKGQQILNDLRSANTGCLQEQTMTDILHYQQCVNYPKPLYYEELIRILKQKNTLRYVVDKYIVPKEGTKRTKIERLMRVGRLLIDQNLRGL